MPKKSVLQSATDSPLQGGRLALLRNRSFLSLWIAGAGWNTIHWLELLVVGVFVFERTGSAFLVALMGVSRILPFALFGALAGAMAARVDRRLALLVGLACMIPLSLGLGLLAATGRIEIWHIALGSFVSGTIWALDFPVRRPLMAEAAGAERVGIAMGFDAVTTNGSRVIGPVAGGLLLEVFGLEGTFFLSAALYAIAVIATAALPPQGRPAGSGGSSVLRAAIIGFAYLRREPTLAGLMSITIVFNLWGFPFASMLPVIGKDILGLSPFPIGVLASIEGAGSLLGALAVALWGRLPDFRRYYVCGTGVYLLAALGFGGSKWVLLSGIVLFVAGLSGALFGVMQSTLVLLNSPPALRSQIMGVLLVCIGIGPIGFLHVGLLAAWLGAPNAVMIVATEGLVTLAYCTWRWPALWATQTITPPATE